MSTEHTKNWPDLAIGLYEQLTGKNAMISYEFVDMHVKVPSGTGPQAEHAEWILSGTMKIRTGDGKPAPKLMLAGRIDGAVDGRPVSLIAESQNLVFAVQRWRTLLTIRRSSRSLFQPLQAILTRSEHSTVRSD